MPPLTDMDAHTPRLCTLRRLPCPAPRLLLCPALQRKLLSAAFLRNTDRTDGNARSSRSHAIFITQVAWVGRWRCQHADGTVAAGMRRARLAA